MFEHSAPLFCYGIKLQMFDFLFPWDSKMPLQKRVMRRNVSLKKRLCPSCFSLNTSREKAPPPLWLVVSDKVEGRKSCLDEEEGENLERRSQEAHALCCGGTRGFPPSLSNQQHHANTHGAWRWAKGHVRLVARLST